MPFRVLAQLRDVCRSLRFRCFAAGLFFRTGVATLLATAALPSAALVRISRACAVLLASAAASAAAAPSGLAAALACAVLLDAAATTAAATPRGIAVTLAPVGRGTAAVPLAAAAAAAFAAVASAPRGTAATLAAPRLVGGHVVVPTGCAPALVAAGTAAATAADTATNTTTAAAAAAGRRPPAVAPSVVLFAADHSSAGTRGVLLGPLGVSLASGAWSLPRARSAAHADERPRLDGLLLQRPGALPTARHFPGAVAK